MKYSDFLPTERKQRCKCGKVAFDKKTAQTKKNFLLRLGNEKDLRIYQCPVSNNWHITKKMKWRP
jgi:hypothetical protein